MSARSLAKIGQLFLDPHQKIINREWLKKSSQPNPYFLNPDRDLTSSEGFAYSAQWWLNTALPMPDGSKKSRYPGLPDDAILALGHWGQMMVILPKQNIVIVRTGEDKKGRLNRDMFFELFMKAYKQAYP